MALPAPTRLEPPHLAPPTAPDGMHSPAWAEHHQAVADRLAAIERRLGVTDGSDATAGQIGEYMEATGTGVSLTSGVAATVATLNLTAGDWDVSGHVLFSSGAGTHGAFAAGITAADTFIEATFGGGSITEGLPTKTVRQSLAAPASVDLVASAAFTGTVTVDGTIRARRMR